MYSPQTAPLLLPAMPHPMLRRDFLLTRHQLLRLLNRRTTLRAARPRLQHEAPLIAPRAVLPRRPRLR